MSGTQFYYPYPDPGAYLLGKERDTILASVGKDDCIVYMARQRRISGAVISPSVVMTTDRRVVIINRWLGGIKSDIAFIPYENVASVRIAHGVIFSSLFVRIKGSSRESGLAMGDAREEGQINGLNRKDANLLFKHINGVIKANGESRSEGRHNNIQRNMADEAYQGGEQAKSGNYQRPAYLEQGDPETAYVEQTQEGTNSYTMAKDYAGVTLQNSGMSQHMQLPQVPMPTADIMVNNGEIAHRTSPEDMLIFRLRKSVAPITGAKTKTAEGEGEITRKIEPEDLMIFRMRTAPTASAGQEPIHHPESAAANAPANKGETAQKITPEDMLIFKTRNSHSAPAVTGRERARLINLWFDARAKSFIKRASHGVLSRTISSDAVRKEFNEIGLEVECDDRLLAEQWFGLRAEIFIASSAKGWNKDTLEIADVEKEFRILSSEYLQLIRNTGGGKPDPELSIGNVMAHSGGNGRSDSPLDVSSGH